MTDNEKTISNIFSDAYQDIKNICKVTKEGVVQFLKPGDRRSPAAFEADGNSMVSTAKNRRYGTRHKVEGEWVSNPASHLPSSAFTPAPSVISSLFSGPIAFISKDSPTLVIGLIAVVAAFASKDKKNALYITTYNNIDTVIIDNEEVEQELFGTLA